MKVLFITGSLNQGGAEYQILKLAELFKQKGNKVEIFALTDYKHFLDFVHEKDLTYNHLNNDQPKLKRILLISRKIKTYKPDLIISYLRITSMVTLLAKLLAFSRARLIIGERTNLKRPFKDFFYFNFMSLFSRITVNSITRKNFAIKLAIFSKNRICYIPNILDTNIFNAGNTIKNSSEEIAAIYVGRIAPEKNIINLLKAVDCINSSNYNIELKLYGESNNRSYLEVVKSTILNCTYPDKIKLMGSTSNPAEVYKSSDLFFLLSDYEGMSNALIEAMACGLPVIISDIEENRFLVEDNVNGFLVKQFSIESIVTAIKKFISLDDSDIIRIRYQNINKIKSIFNNDNIFKGYLRLIKNE